MSARSFLDSNVLIYTDTADEDTKRCRALEVFASLRRAELGVVSTQVLQEYFSVTTRKLGTDKTVARRKVELFSHLDTVQLDTSLILEAIDLHRLHALSFWDALIVRAAQRSHCAVLFSEDLQAGQRFGDVEIVNPFAQA